MKKNVLILWGLMCFLSLPVNAQLAANPWENKSASQDKLQQAAARSTPSMGVNQRADDNDWNLALPNYKGDNTVWTIDRGQDKIAPDVNITNMLLMTQHLRNMGYQIPDGLDNLINTAPARLRAEIWMSMQELQGSSNPVAVASTGFAEIFEKRTGFSIENLIGNSLRLIDSRR